MTTDSSNADLRPAIFELSAITRQQYSVVVLVPSNWTSENLEDFAKTIYENSDGTEFSPDPDYWEKGTLSGRFPDPDEQVRPTHEIGDNERIEPIYNLQAMPYIISSCWEANQFPHRCVINALTGELISCVQLRGHTLKPVREDERLILEETLRTLDIISFGNELSKADSIWSFVSLYDDLPQWAKEQLELLT